MRRILLCAFLLTAFVAGGCDNSQEDAAPIKHVTADHQPTTATRQTPPTTADDSIAIIKSLGLILDHQSTDYVQYRRGSSLVVDVDLDGNSISVTPMDDDATAETEMMIADATEVFEALGLPIDGLSFSSTATDISEATTQGWTITAQRWPNGIGGMFVSFSATR